MVGVLDQDMALVVADVVMPDGRSARDRALHCRQVGAATAATAAATATDSTANATTAARRGRSGRGSGGDSGGGRRGIGGHGDVRTTRHGALSHAVAAGSARPCSHSTAVARRGIGSRSLRSIDGPIAIEFLER